jgi:hypothetical protein
MENESKLAQWATSSPFRRWLLTIDLLAALVVTAVLARCDGLVELGNPLQLVVKLAATFVVAVVEASIVLFGTLGIVYALTQCCTGVRRRRRADA